MSKPQAGIDTFDTMELESLDLGIQETEQTREDIQKAKDALLAASNYYYSGNMPNEWAPWVTTTIAQTQAAIAAAEAGNNIDLEPYSSLEKLLQAGYLREQRARQMENLSEVANIQTSEIENRLEFEVLNPEARSALEQELATVQQQQLAIKEPVKFAIQQEQEQERQRTTLKSRLPTVQQRVQLNKVITDAEINRAIENDPSLSVEEARVLVSQNLQPLLDRIIIDPSGQEFALRYAIPPSEGVDFRTGKIFDRETNTFRDAPAWELLLESLKPQVLGTRENLRTGEPRKRIDPTIQETGETLKELVTDPTVAGLISPIGLVPAMAADLPPRVVTRGDEDIIVESPTSWSLRLMGAIPSAITGIVADGLTYTIDDDGNPIDPNDFAYKLNQSAMMAPYREYAPWAHGFQPVKSDDDFLNANTTLNRAFSSIAEVGFNYTVKKAAPNWNVDLESEYWKNKPDVMKYGAYLADTYLGAMALTTDLLMPLDPAAYTGGAVKVFRQTGLAKYGPSGSLAYALNVEDKYNTLLKGFEQFRLTNPLEAITSAQARSAYRAELSGMFDEAFYSGEGLSTFNNTLKGATINNMQNTVARETASELTNLQMYRLTGNAKYKANIRLPNVAIDDYASWVQTKRSIDNPLRIPITIADQLLLDAKAMRTLKPPQRLVTTKLYTSAFRSNLLRVGVKKPQYKNQLLAAYKINNPDAVPDSFYKILAKDDQVLAEAMQKTLKDAFKDDLYARLPVDQIMVGSNRIVNINQFTDANQNAVAQLVKEFTAHKFTMPKGSQQQQFVLTGNKEKNIEAFINGVGVDEIRQSEQLQDLLRAIDNGTPLTPEQFTVYKHAVLDTAWDMTVKDSRQPILLTQQAYLEASELSHNTIHQARTTTLAKQYVQSIRNDTVGIKDKIISIISPAMVARSRAKLIKEGVDVTAQRAYLSNILLGNTAISRTTVPYFALKREIDFLKSTTFDNLINDIKLYMVEAKSKGVTQAGQYAMNKLLIDATEQQIRIDQRILQSRFDRELVYLSESMESQAAIETAWQRTKKYMQDTDRFNLSARGIDLEKITVDELVGETIPLVARESTLYALVTDFLDSFWYIGAKEESRRAVFTATARNAINTLLQKDPNASLNTGLLQRLVSDINKQIPALEKTQIVADKSIIGALVGEKAREYAWAESISLYIMSLRGQTRMKSSVNNLMIRYPSMYTDLILTPLQKLNRITNKDLLVENAVDQAAKNLDEGPLKTLFSAIRNDTEIKQFFVLTNEGSPLKAIETSNPTLFAAYNRFVDVIENTLLQFGRSKGLSGAKLDDFVNAKNPDYNDLSFAEQTYQSIKNLMKSYEVSAQRALQLSSKDLSGFSADMIQGIVLNNLSLAKTSPSNLWKLTYIASKDGALKSSSDAMFNSTRKLVRLFEPIATSKEPIQQLFRLGVANTYGLNGAYSGNISNLLLSIQKNISEVSGIAPMSILENEITSVLNSYGMRIIPYSDSVAQKTGDAVNAAAKVVDNFRPRFTTLDTEGIALYLGKDMADDFVNLKRMAQGAEWKQVLDNYKLILQSYEKYGRQVPRLDFNGFFDVMSRMTHTGLLGGIGPRPNFRYLAINLISSPIIMAVELGFTGALKTVGWLGADFKFISGKWNPDDVYMVTKQGVSITYRDYTKLLREQNIATTFSAAQFHSTSLSELVRAFEVTSDLKQASQIQQASRWYLDPRKRTRFTMWAHHSDMMLRRSAFSNALQDGATPTQAAELSRRALLDYGKARATALTQQAGKVVAFWSFQWESLKSVSRSLWKGRGDAVKIARTQDGFNREQETYFVGNSKDHARIFRFLVEKGNEKNVVAAGFYNPAYESLSILTEGMAMTTGMLYNEFIEKETYRQQREDLYTAINSRTPWLPLYAAIYSGVIDDREGRAKYESYRFLQPMYIPAMIDNSPFRERMITMFDLDEVAPREFDPQYKGYAYKFRTAEDEQNFALFETFLLTIAVQRGLKDLLKTSIISDMYSDQYAMDRGYYNGIHTQLEQLGLDSPMAMHVSSLLAYELAIATPLRENTPEVLFIREELRRQRTKEAMKPTK